MNGDTRLHDHCEQEQYSPVFRFNYAHLLEKGFTLFTPGETDLVVVLRGTGMIDVFDRSNWRQFAFLDFDIQGEIHLNSAFGSPLIGLPFSAALQHSQGVSLHRFDDLRQNHHYGFFVEPDYRNKGRIGIWNLDELMLAIALEYAEDHNLQWFHIKPTGDTASYYRHKYGATRLPTTSPEKTLSICLGIARKLLPHVRPIQQAGRTRYLDVQTAPNASWLSD